MVIDGFDADVALIPMDKEESHGEPEIVLDLEDCPERYYLQSDIDQEYFEVMYPVHCEMLGIPPYPFADEE